MMIQRLIRNKEQKHTIEDAKQMIREYMYE